MRGNGSLFLFFHFNFPSVCPEPVWANHRFSCKKFTEKPVSAGDQACDLASEAYGDLVEYCKGDGTTAWGKKRIADGHPAPYNVTHFE